MNMLKFSAADGPRQPEGSIAFSGFARESLFIYLVPENSNHKLLISDFVQSRISPFFPELCLAGPLRPDKPPGQSFSLLSLSREDRQEMFFIGLPFGGADDDDDDDDNDDGGPTTNGP